MFLLCAAYFRRIVIESVILVNANIGHVQRRVLILDFSAIYIDNTD